MVDIRYPETPHIESRGKDVTIAYNGVKIHLRRAPTGNTFYTDMTKIERTLDGKVEEDLFEEGQLSFLPGPTGAPLKPPISKKRNIYQPEARQEVIQMVREYAHWFDDETAGKLEDLLKRQSRPEMQRQPTQAMDGGNPHKTFHDMQKKMNREVYSLMFRRNISPREAARRLGYDPNEF